MSNKDYVETIPPESDPASDFPWALAIRLGERPLWVGNGGAADPEHLAELGVDPGAVVSLTLHQTSATTDHYPLNDGVINDPRVFGDAVETVREYYREDTVTLVHCAAGISRSSTVLATAIAAEEGYLIEGAVDTVRKYRERARPHPKLRINACDYLGYRCDREYEREAAADYLESVSVSAADSEAVIERVRADGSERKLTS